MEMDKGNEGSSSMTKKSILSQVLAASAQNLMLLNLGLAVTFPSIVIPSLLGADESLSLTQNQASWFGSIGLIMQPIGSLLSGTLMEPFGRKMSLLIVNIPHVVAWLIMYFVQDVTWLFIGNIIIGLGIGFMEAPLMTYVGEISHPTMRGVLTGYCQIFVGIGFFLSYMFGSIFTWRNAALISLSIPIITLIAIITIVPETPVWLISKGRMDDAMKSLCRLRGWTTPDSVQKEFDEIVLYHKNSTACQQCAIMSPTQIECTHRKVGVFKLLKEIYEAMNRKQMLRPLFLIMFIYLIQQFTGVMAIKPNLVNIFRSFGLPIDPYTATNITSGLGLVALIIIVCIIKWVGKRTLALMSLLVLSICNLLLGFYAYHIFPPGFTTYNKITQVENQDMSWLPTLLFASLHIAYYLGIGPMPWLMLSEIFPLRGRGHAVGIAAAASYVFCALTTKTHFDMELAMGIHGTFWLYSAASFFGLISLYFYLPETEGKKFEQIESEFSGRHMKVVANDVVTIKLKRIFGHRRNAVEPISSDKKDIEIEEGILLQKKIQNMNDSTKL